MKYALAATVLLLGLACVWGIGAAVRRICGAEKPDGPVSIGVGLAVIVFAGGFLNLAHIAYGPFLLMIAAGGLVLAVIESRRVTFEIPKNLRSRIELAAVGTVIVLVIGFTIATQLPPKAYNSVDDFQKYFAHPVRMLETGSLLGSPLSVLGSQALGGQAFLQGFALSWLPIDYINGVDAVFGLFLLMLMAAAAGWRLYSPFPGAMVGPILLAVINPHYVNVSCLYLGSVLMATALLLVTDGRETKLPAPLILGLVYGALVVLKTSFAPFVAFHLALCVPALKGETGSWKLVLAWGGKVALWTGIGLAPWLLLHLPNYLSKGTFPRDILPDVEDETLRFWSTEQLHYGASFAHYTAIVSVAGAVGLCALIALWRRRGKSGGRVEAGILAGAGACVLSYVALLLMGPIVAGYLASLRYSIPIILGTGVFAIILFPKIQLPLPRGLAAGAVLLICAAVVGIFSPSLAVRYRQAVQTGSILAFTRLASLPEYRSYTRFCLDGPAAESVRKLQEKVPPGAPLLAWIDTPFLLDYKRNIIFDVDVNGLSTSWAHIPDNVHYIMWQYRGFKGFGGIALRGTQDYEKAMEGPGKQERIIAARGLALFRRMQELSTHATIIASDGETALFQVDAVNR